MFKVGDRVYYKPRGKDDTGTVTNVTIDDNLDVLFEVTWDSGPEDEKIDEFTESDLSLIDR